MYNDLLYYDSTLELKNKFNNLIYPYRQEFSFLIIGTNYDFFTI